MKRVEDPYSYFRHMDPRSVHKRLLTSYPELLLGSGSPRRRQLLEGIGWPIQVLRKDVPEVPPGHLQGAEVALHLAEFKAMAFDEALAAGQLLLTADTIVWQDGHVLGKPVDRADAVRILDRLQGNRHQVFTGVCLSLLGKRYCFSVETTVTFRPLSSSEIETYIDEYQPYDKAGAYGAQECLPKNMNPCSTEERAFLEQLGKPRLFEESLAADPDKHVPIISSIDGSYFNVMGLPIFELYRELDRFLP